MELGLSDSEIDAHYIHVLKSHLLPPLGRMMRNPELSVQERGKAIKFLADGSLALAGSGAEWSAALGNKLRRSAMGKKTSSVLSPTSRSSSSRSSRATRLLQKRRLQAAKARFSRQFQRSSHHRLSRVYSPTRRSQLKLCRRIPKPRKLQRGSSTSSTRLQQEQMLESRMKALQGLVPGGSNMNCSVLLDETADYMMFLKFQVGVLQSLASAIEKSHLHAAASGA